MSSTPSIALVYDSGFGHTAIVAEEVAKGLRSVNGVEVTLFKAGEVKDTLDILAPYSAIIFGTPTYMGGVTATFKAFMDATGKLWYAQQWKDKFAAGFTNSGGLSGDKLLTLQHLAVFAAQHSMLWISQGLMYTPAGTDTKHGGHPEDVNRIGSYLGLMTQSDNVAPTQTPSDGDKKTAFLFGARVATVVKRFA